MGIHEAEIDALHKLAKQLDFPCHVGAGHGNVNHVGIDADAVIGRMTRKKGSFLCNPKISFMGITSTPMYSAQLWGPTPRVCAKCVERAQKLVGELA